MITPCSSDAVPHSVPRPSSFSLYVPYFDPLPSVLSYEDDLHVLPPTGTHSKTSFTVTLTRIHAESSSSKPGAKYSLIKEHNFVSLSKLTTRKRKLYERIQNKENVLCKLKRKYKTKKLENISWAESDTVMENHICVNRLPSCWQQLLDTVQKHKGRRWEF